MSITLQFTITTQGKAAAWNANNTGIDLALTHAQFGSGNKAPDGSETALITPQQTASIAAGFQVSPTQIRMSCIFGSASTYPIREIGIWAGDPAAGGILFGYWSQASGDLATKDANIDFIFNHDMILDASIPPGSITVLVDSAQGALIAAHEAALDPHPQYLTKPEGDSYYIHAHPYEPVGAVAAHVALADPHPQYLTKPEGDSYYSPLGHTHAGLTQATETVMGIAEIANQAETNAGTDDQRIVTPLKLRAGFAISLNPNGYIKFPQWLGGFTLQWGVTADYPNEGTQYVAFPVAFPNAILGAVATAEIPAKTNTRNQWAQLYALTAAGMEVYLQMEGGGVWPIKARWFAVGY